MNIKSRINLERLLTYSAFISFFLITCHKLTSSPLWYDETIEYWFSKVLIGKIPFNSAYAVDTTNMYQRIVSTYQPPLYNFLMYFWLKVSSNEFWFRFFGVLMGFIGNVGVYKTVKKIANGYVAAFSVFFTSFISRLVYYWQECAEYCLMLGTLCWTIYFFINLIKVQSLKNIIWFTLFSIIPIYSQYGAAFPVASMLLVAYIYMLMKKDKLQIIKMTVSYLLAFIFAALPLFYFFLLKQVNSQQSQILSVRTLEFEVNFVFDFVKNYVVVIYSNLFSSAFGAIVFSTVYVISEAFILFFSTKIYPRCLAIVNILTYILYYFAVKANLYAYGSFKGKYVLFFIPLLIVSTICFGIEVIDIIHNRFIKSIKFYRASMAIIICLLFCYTFINCQTIIRNVGTKQGMRDVVNKWIECVWGG